MAGNAIVHIVDDDLSVLKSLARLLGSAGFDARTYTDARLFLRDLDPETPGCLILDRQMPEIDGHVVQRWLSGKRAPLPVIFLTGEGDIGSSVRAMKDGAVDYLTKPVEPEVLLTTVERAIGIDRARREARAASDDFEARLDSLTAREREVLDAAVAGRLNKQIAYDLDIVEKTVKVHRARVMRKMGAQTLADLVTMVVRHRDRT
ncbi:response regulator transcription factor [Palleronia sp. KMU-117]|uniref:response regulator transcription factor n=1 Tax=Palleronia sp. KMU-117 TaxID=3434108 RepID=UPI003D73FC3B